MNLIFCGTPQFAVPTLTRLLGAGFKIELVVTNPDEPAGRGYGSRPPAVKTAAEKAGLRVFQPAKLKDISAREYLSRFRPDAIIVVAYGHIIPPWMIGLPRLGCVNLHASLLPRYRGAAPIQWAIIRGEKNTGVTTMQIDAGLDTGDILLQKEVEIRGDDTADSLSERLGVLGANLMIETLRGIEAGVVLPRKQDSQLATLAPMLKKEDGRIDWSLTAEEIGRRVRGLRPWPGAYSKFRGQPMQVWMASPAEGAADSRQATGTLEAAGGTLKVICGGGTLLGIQEVQWAGRKRVAARDFLNGARLAPGEKLG